jgi:flagellar biosynthesis GTPase FlhF
MLSIVISEMSSYTFKIVHTTNIFAALEALSNYQFSFVMIDNIFANENMTGIELCYRLKSRRIKQMSHCASPLVVISGQYHVSNGGNEDGGSTKYPCLTNKELEICNKCLVNMSMLKEMLNRYAIPMSKFDAMQSITHSLAIFSRTCLTNWSAQVRNPTEKRFENIIRRPHFDITILTNSSGNCKEMLSKPVHIITKLPDEAVKRAKIKTNCKALGTQNEEQQEEEQQEEEQEEEEQEEEEQEEEEQEEEEQEEEEQQKEEQHEEEQKVKESPLPEAPSSPPSSPPNPPRKALENSSHILES